MSSIYVYFVGLASLAFVVDKSVGEYPDWSLQYLKKLDDATRSHFDDVMFLQKVMEVDYLWLPILYEMVKIKVPNVLYFNRYANPGEPKDLNDLRELVDHADQAAPADPAEPAEPAEPEDPENIEIIVLPFALFTNLMTGNKFSGSEVQFVMNAFKSAMSCSVLKHVSLQGIMYHTLMDNFSDTVTKSEKEMFHDWMVDMVQISIDKLTAIDHSQDPKLPITRTRMLLAKMRRELPFNEDLHFTNGGLYKIGLAMFEEIKKTCVVPKGEVGHYSALVFDLYNDSRVKELKAHRTQLTENMREASNLEDVFLMYKDEDKIQIERNITPEGIFELDSDTLKRAAGANHIQMKFLYLNLPIRTLAQLQWTTISQAKLTSNQSPTSPTIP